MQQTAPGGVRPENSSGVLLRERPYREQRIQGRQRSRVQEASGDAIPDL